MLPEGLHEGEGVRKGRAVHSPFTTDVTTSSKMSFTTSWAPSSVPAYTPNTNTHRVFPGKRKEGGDYGNGLLEFRSRGQRCKCVPSTTKSASSEDPLRCRTQGKDLLGFQVSLSAALKPWPDPFSFLRPSCSAQATPSRTLSKSCSASWQN